MLSRVIETTCRLFHSPVKFLRNKHDKVVTGKHMFFSCIGRTILVQPQLEQNYVGLVHFMFISYTQPILGSGLFSFSLLSILALIFISLVFLFISSCIFYLYSFIFFFYVTTTFHCIFCTFACSTSGLLLLLFFFFRFLFLIWAIIHPSFKFSREIFYLTSRY